MMTRITFHRAEAHLRSAPCMGKKCSGALNQSARGLALGLALLLVIFSLAGCARRSAVSLRIVSVYSGKGVANATLTFTGSSGSETLSSDATGTVSGQVEADRTQMGVEATGYQKAFMQVTDLTKLPATVQLTPLFLGVGTVKSGGQPVVGASVTVWNTTTTTGSDGTFTFEGSQKGPMREESQSRDLPTPHSTW